MARCPHTAPAHVLVAGSGADLGAITDAVLRIPEDAYGQVFVEVASDAAAPSFDLPEGVSLTVLRPASIRGIELERGERVARAVQAWIAEWMCEDESDTPRVIWLGGLSCEPIMRLHSDIRERFPHLHEHRSA